MPRAVARVDQGHPEVCVISLTPTSRKPVREPVIVVTGNLHGDECTGLGVCLLLADRVEPLLLRGSVHLYPSLNPDGLQRRTRRHPDEDIDMNRLFPGDPGGNPAERHVHAVWNDICARTPDLLIDIHADSPDSVPYALTDRAVSLRGIERLRLEGDATRAAVATGLTVLQEYPDDRYQRYRLDRSLTGATLNQLHVPALTIEAGPRLVLDSAAMEIAYAGVMGVLAEFGMVAERPPAHASRLPGGFRRDSGPRSAVSGVLLPQVRPGVLVRRGDVLAEVQSLGGVVLERVRAEGDGFVVSFVERAHVVRGVPVCTFGFVA